MPVFVRTRAGTPCGHYIVQGHWKSSGQYFRSCVCMKIRGLPMHLTLLESPPGILCPCSCGLGLGLHVDLTLPKETGDHLYKNPRPCPGTCHSLSLLDVSCIRASVDQSVEHGHAVTSCRHLTYDPRRLEIIWTICVKIRGSTNHPCT